MSSFEFTPNRTMLDKMWPVRLAYDLGYVLLNHATWNADIMHDMRKQVIEAFDYKPEISVVFLGSVESKQNDIYKTYRYNVDMLRKSGRVFCIGILPSSKNWVKERRAVHNPKIKRVCDELDCTYVDVRIEPDLHTTEGFHANEKGHEEIYKTCLSLIFQT